MFRSNDLAEFTGDELKFAQNLLAKRRNQELPHKLMLGSLTFRQEKIIRQTVDNICNYSRRMVLCA